MYSLVLTNGIQIENYTYMYQYMAHPKSTDVSDRCLSVCMSVDHERVEQGRAGLVPDVTDRCLLIVCRS